MMTGNDVTYLVKEGDASAGGNAIRLDELLFEARLAFLFSLRFLSEAEDMSKLQLAAEA